ncbi:hypothetical protein, partial [Streptococcus mitis]|uniref:hypothetical protein n=1 Tax=Streptococcus mitis TaxID=28037 RepID=UPI0020017118
WDFFSTQKRLHNIHRGFTHYKYYRAFVFRGQKRGKTFQDSSFTNKYDSANIIENDGKKGEFMIYFNVGPF